MVALAHPQLVGGATLDHQLACRGAVPVHLQPHVGDRAVDCVVLRAVRVGIHPADEALGRQVRIEGPVTRVPRGESEAYAHNRSRQSQLSALASPQSQPVPSRDWLEQRVAELDREHAGAELPVREDWGGYRLAPEAWEFWQHRPNRLHDRFRYLPKAGGWRIERLGP